MAFPTVESAAVTEFFSGPTTTHNVLMPATVDAGDLLLAVVFITGTSAITASGWTEIRTGTTADNNERLSVLAKVAVGNEGGTTVDFQTSSAAFAIVHLYRISGWFGDIAGVEASVMATGSGTGPNPPSLTVSWGSDDNLFIAVGAKSTGTVTGAPANFTNLLSGPSNANMGSARRAIVSATQDPGSFSGSTSAQWVATTIGVRPAAAADPVPELTAALAVELNLAGDAATPPATIPEVSAALDVAVDLVGAAEAPAATVPEITSSLAIDVGLAGVAETPSAEVPELAASLNLAVDLAGDVAAPPATVPEITSSLAIGVDLAGAAETPPDEGDDIAVEVGEPFVRWSTEEPFVRWSTEEPFVRWSTEEPYIT